MPPRFVNNNDCKSSKEVIKTTLKDAIAEVLSKSSFEVTGHEVANAADDVRSMIVSAALIPGVQVYQHSDHVNVVISHVGLEPKEIGVSGLDVTNYESPELNK